MIKRGFQIKKGRTIKLFINNARIIRKKKECKPRHHHPEGGAKLNQGPPDKGVSTLIESTQKTADTCADTQVIGLQ